MKAFVLLQAIIQFTKKIGRSATTDSVALHGVPIQFTKKIGRSATAEAQLRQQD